MNNMGKQLREESTRSCFLFWENLDLTGRGMPIYDNNIHRRAEQRNPFSGFRGV